MAEKFRFLKRFLLHVGDTFTGTDTSANFFQQCLFTINLGKWKHIFFLKISPYKLGESDV
jgi:hypothetical protein